MILGDARDGRETHSCDATNDFEDRRYGVETLNQFDVSFEIGGQGKLRENSRWSIAGSDGGT